MSAQTDYPFSWNPDADSDGFITVEDLMALLVLFGTEFKAGILESDSLSATLVHKKPPPKRGLMGD